MLALLNDCLVSRRRHCRRRHRRRRHSLRDVRPKARPSPSPSRGRLRKRDSAWRMAVRMQDLSRCMPALVLDSIARRGHSRREIRPSPRRGWHAQQLSRCGERKLGPSDP